MTIDQTKPHPTPWSMEPCGDIRDADGEFLGSLVSAEDARRAVACVNKCENLTDEELADARNRLIVIARCDMGEIL